MLDMTIYRKLRNYIDRVFDEANEEDFSLDEYIYLQSALIACLNGLTIYEGDDDPEENYVGNDDLDHQQRLIRLQKINEKI